MPDAINDQDENSLPDDVDSVTVTDGRLRLFIAGNSPQSMQAILNLNKLHKQHLQDEFSVEVIDIYQQPQLAKDFQIIAIPTLIKMQPLPETRIIGSLTDSRKVLTELGLMADTEI